MDEEQIRQDRESEEARQAILDIEEGRKSLYWKHIEAKIKVWLLAEERAKRKLNDAPIYSEKDIYESNMALERVNLLKQFLGINEVVIKEKLQAMEMSKPQESLLDRIRGYIPTFVGKPAETNSNGRV